MDQTTLSWEQARSKNLPVLPVVSLSCPLGEFFFGLHGMDDTIINLGKYFDALVTIDSAVQLDGGIDVAGLFSTLASVDQVEESTLGFDEAILGSWGQSVRPVTSFDLDNEDGALSRLIGQQYLMGQPAKVYFTFPGVSLANAVVKGSGIVSRLVLSKANLRVELQGV